MSTPEFNINHITDLARLHLKEKEEEKLEKDLEEILDYVGKLQQVDTEGVDGFGSVSDLHNVTREDNSAPKEHVKKSPMEKIRACFPNIKNNFVKIVRILER